MCGLTSDLNRISITFFIVVVECVVGYAQDGVSFIVLCRYVFVEAKVLVYYDSDIIFL